MSTLRNLTNTGGFFYVRPELRNELILALLVVVAATLLPAALGAAFWAQTLLVANLYLIAAVGLNVLMAEAGQISFGHGVIFGSAAYSSAMMLSLAESSFFAAAAVGVAVGVAVGLIMALPALRVQSYYLAFVTMAAALTFPEVLMIFDKQTHAVTGLVASVPWLTDEVFPGFPLITFVLIVISCLALTSYALIRSSPFGRDLRMTGHSAEAGSTLAMNPGFKRVIAFGASAFIAALAGVLYTPLIGFASPTSFTIDLSVVIFLAVVVGGKGTIIGPVVGVAIVYLVPDVFLADFSDYRLILFGVIAFLFMFFMPDGVVGYVRNLLARRRPTPAASDVDLETVLASARKLDGTDVEKRGSTLSVAGVEKSFGSVRALQGASLEVAAGELHAIVGPNGSGKTSLLNVLSGLYVPDKGEVQLDGRNVTKASVTKRARLGLGRTFQTPKIMSGLSTWENVDLGSHGHGEEGSMRQVIWDNREAWDRIPVDALSHAQRRFLEVARVMHRESQLWLLDEPAAGLSQTERRHFGEMLQAVTRTWGTTIIIVEHDLELVWSIADRISVVEAGRVIASGTPAELDEHDDVRHIFLGARDAAH